MVTAIAADTMIKTSFTMMRTNGGPVAEAQVVEVGSGCVGRHDPEREKSEMEHIVQDDHVLDDGVS